MPDRPPSWSSWRLPPWAPLAGLLVTLTFAWINFLLTSKWSALPGSLHGWRQPWYAAALVAATVFLLGARRQIGQPVRLGRPVSLVVFAAGASVIVAVFLTRLPPTTWTEIPFKDDWTPLFQEAVNGVALFGRGVVVGWNWWYLGGYQTSADVAQNLAAVGVVPMTIFGSRVGYHVLHAVLLLAVPGFVWWDLSQEDRETGWIAGGLACLLSAGFSATLFTSGDTNSLTGVFCAGLALFGSRAAGVGRRWGGPLELLGLTLALYTHAAFFVYAVVFLGLEAVYFRSFSAARRLAVAIAVSTLAAVPVYWESFRYPGFASFNNAVYEPRAPLDWPSLARALYYNVEILALPQRWFNDYRSLTNVWLPALMVVALSRRSRPAFFACAALVAQALLRLNDGRAGFIFDRVQHLLPMLVAPALAGFVLGFAGTRKLAVALIALVGLYVATSFEPIRHVPDIRAFNPALIDRVAAARDGMVLFEISPHRSMDRDPTHHSVRTPFDVHFEGLLAGVAGQRFYSQMWDGWSWLPFRGHVVGAGTYLGDPIDRTPPEAFVAELRRWGIRHLFVWTDTSRDYLTRSGRFVERWHEAPWSQFELADADTRSVVTRSGSGALGNLDFLGATVDLSNVTAGDPVVVRTNYYPAWRAFVEDREVSLYPSGGQLMFHAPQSGSYTVRLAYPRYRWLTIPALTVFLLGLWVLSLMDLRSPASAAAAA